MVDAALDMDDSVDLSRSFGWLAISRILLLNVNSRTGDALSLLDAVVDNGELHISFQYSSEIFVGATIDRVLEGLRASLVAFSDCVLVDVSVV